MPIFTNNASPFNREPPFPKKETDFFTDLKERVFGPKFISPVRDHPQEEIFTRKRFGEAVGKRLEPIKKMFRQPKQEFISPLAEGRGKGPSLKEQKLKMPPPWRTDPIVVDKIKNLDEKTRKSTSRWEEDIAKTFPVSELPNVMKVMFRESSGKPDAVNENKNGSKDYGLMQINDIHAGNIREKFGYNMEDLFDPKKNLEVARWIWERSGWFPWVGAKKAGVI